MRRLLISIIAAISLLAQPVFASGFSSTGAAASATTLTGDATGTGTGTVPVTISGLPLSKLATQAASSLLGNATGSSAAPTAISLGPNFTFSGSTLYGAVEHPGYISGNWYATVPFATAVAGAAVPANSIRLMPFTISKTITPSQLAARITTISASGNFQLAYYANNATTGHPTSTAICTTGNLSTGTLGPVSGTATCASALTPGTYWEAVNQDNAVAAYTTLGLGAAGTSYLVGSATLANITSNSTTQFLTLTTAQTFGTWPDLTSASFAETATSTSALVFMKAQ